MENSEYLINYIKEKKNQLYLLQKINNYRINSEIGEDAFIFVKEFFSYILNSKKNIDITIIEKIVILSITFYCSKDTQKKFLYEELKKDKRFRDLKVWKQLLDNFIQGNLKKASEVRKRQKMVPSKESVKKNNETLFFSGIMHEIRNVKYFGVNKKIMKDLCSYFLKKYEISEGFKNYLDNIVEGEINSK